MKFFCKELDKSFDTQDEMFLALKAEKENIVKVKKASEKQSDPVFHLLKSADAEKAGSDGEVRLGDYVFAVINTTNYLDSHGDVHLNGIWDVSVKDQQGKIYYIINHDLKLGSIISYPNEVEMSVPEVNWTELGLNYAGTTQALIFKAKITEKSNKDASAAILDKQPLQNSIRMMYVAMDLAVDSKTQGLEEEYANFYKYLPIIANKEEALKQGYFWAIKEAKIWKEGSAVLFGSNDATPILYDDPQSTQLSQKHQGPPNGSVEVVNKHDYFNFYSI